ncbi:MAG: arylamine N-acetyltransferase [Candidatus Glassbacteria bacterium]
MILEPERYRAASTGFFKHFSFTPGGPVRDFLELLMERYTMIPYENLSKIIKREYVGTGPGRLRLPEEVLGDHIERGLGGTCFSLSFYLMSILHNAGLESYICMAHMRRRKNVHCVTVVRTIEGKYLLDPGYVISSPVPMKRNSPVVLKTPHAFVRLTYDNVRRVFDLFSGNRDELKWRYRFSDVPVSLADFLEHWQSSFDQQTMDNICITLRRGNRLVYVHGDYYRESRIDGFSKRRLKQNLHGTIQRVSGVSGQVIEEALCALGLHRKKGND